MAIEALPMLGQSLSPGLFTSQRAMPQGMTERDPRAIALPDDTLTSGIPTEIQDSVLLRPQGQRAQLPVPVVTGRPPMADDPGAWSQPRALYAPKGVPLEAVPAQARLDARIAMEPVYVHHYAASRYAFVSRMPMTLTERRALGEVLA
ncbi:MAG: hypothetical protein FGM26_00975 [Beijerinckiaceae bacterium]|nr:hypothetical protein [Beijerinckiaceae bacterium]